MPLESLLGESIDQRSDVYALGMILYEALTGVLPFDAPTATNSIARVIRDHAPRPRSFRRDLPGGLEHAILSAIAKNAADRTPSMAALIADLSPYAATSRGAEKRAPSARHAPSRTAVRSVARKVKTVARRSPDAPAPATTSCSKRHTPSRTLQAFGR